MNGDECVRRWNWPVWSNWPDKVEPTHIHTYIYIHYRHFKRHPHLKWSVVHQQLHVIRNTAHRPSTQASYTASRVRPKEKSAVQWRKLQQQSQYMKTYRKNSKYGGQSFCQQSRVGPTFCRVGSGSRKMTRGQLWAICHCWRHQLGRMYLKWHHLRTIEEWTYLLTYLPSQYKEVCFLFFGNSIIIIIKQSFITRI